MSEAAPSPVTGLIQQWDEAAWCLGAVAIALAGGAEDAHVSAAQSVLQEALAVGSSTVPTLPDGTAGRRLGAQALAPLLQVGAAAAGSASAWMALPDEALVAQGEASAQAAPMFASEVLPTLGDLAGRLDRPGARMLDVGTGVGAMATAFASAFPELHVTGLDVAPRVLRLAEARLSGHPAAERVTFRLQSVAELEERETYELAWIPAPFVPEPALAEGLARVAAALRPGGWLMLGHGKYAGHTALQQALTRFKTLVYGGTALDEPGAVVLLEDAGLLDVRTLPTPPGAPAITVGRRRS